MLALLCACILFIGEFPLRRAILARTLVSRVVSLFFPRDVLLAHWNLAKLPEQVLQWVVARILPLVGLPDHPMEPLVRAINLLQAECHLLVPSVPKQEEEEEEEQKGTEVDIKAPQQSSGVVVELRDCVKSLASVTSDASGAPGPTGKDGSSAPEDPPGSDPDSSGLEGRVPSLELIIRLV